MEIRIAIDNQVSNMAIAQLEKNGFVIVQKAQDLPDEIWVGEALNKKANFIISPDLDIPNILDRWSVDDCVWVELKQGLKKDRQFSSITRIIERIINRKGTENAK